jgi:putative transposase
LGQARSTQRRKPRVRVDEAALREAMVRLASTPGRYGYRWITALWRRQGWQVNAKRVARI